MAKRRKKNSGELKNRKQEILENNMAKSLVGVSNTKKKRKKKNKISRNIGLGLVGIQICASLIFMVSLLMLGMIPNKYLIVIAGVLGGIALLILLGQCLSKNKAIIGKLFSVFMSGVLFLGSFYLVKTNGAVEKISGGQTKLDNMVVAVLADDKADTIKDAADYNFGVQYAIKGEEVQETVDAINKELGQEIQTTEYRSVQEQATKLHNGEVDAIIYNEAYAGILEEEFGDFNSGIKVIYTYSIETVVDNSIKDVNVDDESFCVYISGIDVYGAIETNSRSDVNILAIVNPVSHQIMLVTTPRDYYVEFPGITGGEKDKLTHAGIYGVDVSMATLEELYGIDIEFYARVNFTSVIEIVDALGGIDVYSQYAFVASDGIARVEQGINHLDGEEALSFSRERYSLPGGDFDRGKNQQAVITAIIQKAVSPAILVSANELLDSVSDNVDTNMSKEQINALVKSQLDDPQPWRIMSMAAEGTGDQQYCYSMPDTLLYVTQPNYDSVNLIKEKMNAVKNGEVFEESTVVE